MIMNLWNLRKKILEEKNDNRRNTIIQFNQATPQDPSPQVNVPQATLPRVTVPQIIAPDTLLDSQTTNRNHRVNYRATRNYHRVGLHATSNDHRVGRRAIRFENVCYENT